MCSEAWILTRRSLIGPGQGFRYFTSSTFASCDSEPLHFFLPHGWMSRDIFSASSKPGTSYPKGPSQGRTSLGSRLCVCRGDPYTAQKENHTKYTQGVAELSNGRRSSEQTNRQTDTNSQTQPHTEVLR